MSKGRRFLVAYCAVMIVFLIAPVLIVFPMSLTPTSFMTVPLPSVSFRWYQNFFTSAPWISATQLSLRVGVIATLIAVVLGTFAAFGVVRGRFPGKNVVYAFALSPWIMPQIIIATSLYFVVNRFGLIGNWVMLATAHAVLAIPAVVVIVSGTLKGLDQSLEHAAMSLGANRARTFRRVVLPLILPGVASGALFAFLISLDELLLALFLGGERALTLPRRIWSGIRFDVDPTIAAVGSLLVSVSLVIAVVIGLRRVVSDE